MKFIALVLLLSLSSAFGTTFICKSKKTGNTYEIDTKYSEIYAYDKMGRPAGSRDGLQTENKFGETFPPQTTYVLRDGEDDSVVASVTIFGKLITGTCFGDSGLVCESKK